MTTLWLAALTVVVLCEALVIARLTRQPRSPNRPEVVSKPADGGEEPVRPARLVIGQPLSFLDGPLDVQGAPAVVVFASVRSVSAHHAVAIVRRLVEREPSPIPWRWFVAGRDIDIERFGGSTQRCIPVSDDLVGGACAGGHPLAAYVDGSGCVVHAGPIWSMASLLTFIEACPMADFRQWFARAASGDPEMSRHNDVGRRAPVSPLNVLDHWGSTR